MKTLRSTLTTLACLSAMAGATTHGQEAPRTLSALPAPPAADVAVLPAPPGAAPAALQFVQAPVAHEAIGIAEAVSELPGTPVAWAAQHDGFLVDLLGAPRPRTLVIRTGESDPKTVSALEEDMSIMSRILAKAANEKASDDDAMTAMGMKLKALTVSGHSPVQNLYLDGYGALFLLSVRYPLLPSPEPAKEESRKAPTNTAWEETRRELYGAKEPAPGMKSLFLRDSSREAYDAKKVAKLKESLVESLTNAANIRDLKAGDFVTLVVTGSDNAAVVKATSVESRGEGTGRVFGFSSGGRSSGWVRGPRSSGGETTMTLRAKKSDIDAFAKGDLKLDEFQKKVASATY